MYSVDGGRFWAASLTAYSYMAECIDPVTTTNFALSSFLARLLASQRAGGPLARPFYTAPEIFAAEIQQIFRKRWLFVGQITQLSRPGDYFTWEIGGDSLILLRDQKSELRALYNVCRHRGARICSETAGHIERLTCPYHQWVYGLDGGLVASRFMPPGFDSAQFGLRTAHLRVIEGLIFICMADQPPDFTEVERDLRAHLAFHKLANAKVCSSRRYRVQANWKLIDENARECYHCPGSHPEYCGAVISAAAATSATATERARMVQSAQEKRWREWGLETESNPFREGTYHSVNRYALHPGAVSESLDGKPVAPLMGNLPDRDVGVVGIGIYPNLLAEACSDHAVTLRFTPLEPQRTEVEMQWLVRGDAREGIDYDPGRVEAIWRATAEQDWKLCELNQQGVNSSRYEPGPYSSLEWGCDHFDQWYVSQLRDGG